MINFKTRDLMVTIQPAENGNLNVYNCEQKSKSTGDETGCTKCTHVTQTDCTKHTKKPPGKSGLEESFKAIELKKLKAAIAGLQK